MTYKNTGHLGYEVMRKSGLTTNTELQGNVDQSMVDAIECGQALKLNMPSSSWTVESAELLSAALAAKGCRVYDIDLNNAETFGAVGAVVLASIAGSLVRELESVLISLFFCVCLFGFGAVVGLDMIPPSSF